MNIKPRVIPFRVGGPIQDPVDFAGRTEVLQAISHAILNLQNVSLRGERRTGKTSLLFYLAHPASASVIGLPENHIPVYFNFQDFASASVVKVWQAMADAIAEQIKSRHPVESERFLLTMTEFLASPDAPELFGTGLGRALAHLGDLGVKFHLLFDEFDQSIRNPNLGDSFYDALRSLPTRTENVSYVIATRTGLATLQPVSNKISSPFFNIFTSMTLGPFHEEEVYRLIFDYFARAELDVALAEKLCAESSFLYEVTGYHPFFLQTLCYHLCARLNKPDWPLGQTREEALQAYRNDAKPHFEFYWELSSNEEQELIKRLAANQSIDWDQPDNTAVIESLKNRCLIVPAIESEQKWRLFSSTFSSWTNRSFKLDTTVGPLYLNFDLFIERSGEKYKARVLNSPAGQAVNEFSIAFSELALENFLLKIGRPRRSERHVGSPEVEATKAFGEHLLKVVFGDAVYSCFHRSLDEARRQGTGLRVRLRLADVPELANVPWEYLYYDSSFDRFLCLSSETPIVRYMDLPEHIRPLAVKLPIRILVMISSPTNYPKLDVEQEWANLNRALDDLKLRGLVTLEKLQNATLAALQRKLRQADYHIFHYFGHGGFDSQSQDGVLIMEDKHSLGHVVSGRNLGTILHDERTLRLVLFNACDGARSTVTDPFAGTAQSLVQQGIPAVVTMQFEITDQAAITLAHDFYAVLADGYPVDAALAEARKAIFAQGNNVEWGTPALYMRSSDGRIFEVEDAQIERKHRRASIFLSYQRDIRPDEPLALELFNRLKKKHDVFMDPDMAMGTSWAAAIEAELKRSEFLIVLLSPQSVNSEIIKAEIETAHHLAKEHGGKPVILPIRLAFRDPFPYPLNAYLDHINWTLWKSDEDTPLLVEELMQAIAGGELSLDQKAKSELLQASMPSIQLEPLHAAQPAKLEMPEGTMDPESTFYVERDGDRVALAAIEHQGVTITIKAPRQMGKSSLLIRVMQRAQQAGKRVVFIDFQLFDKTTMANADVFFRQFCVFLADELAMEDRTEDYWKTPLGNSQRCTRYVERYLLKELDGSLVLAMDEVESIFETAFRSDFFSMLRNWHNSRANKAIWKRLDLALVTSTEPYQLVENLNQSPFNVGEVIDLPDLTLEQIADLNQRHGTALNSDELQKLMRLLGGHPYLTRRALYLVASKRITAADLFVKATQDRGPFGDHLRYHLFRLIGKDDLIQGLRQVLNNKRCPDERIFFRLRGAGLVRHEGGNELPRCQLYADYFRVHLNA